MTWWSGLLKSGSRQPSRSPSDLPYYTALEPSHPGKVRRDFSELETRRRSTGSAQSLNPNYSACLVFRRRMNLC